MGWLDHCISVFDGNPAFVGKMEPGLVPLVPISHTTQKVNIEVALTGKGDFVRARVLRPDEMTTIIPVQRNLLRGPLDWYPIRYLISCSI